MTVEAITYISDLVITNPLAADFINEGDDHIKGIKSALKATFPNINGVVTASPAEINVLDGLTGTIVTSTSTPAAGQWVLMKDTGVLAGLVAAVEFVNGSGGVTISSDYDEYLITFDQVTGSASASLRLQLSSNAGSSYPSDATGSNAQYRTLSSGVAAAGELTAAAYYPLSCELSLTSGSGNAVGGFVRIGRELSGSFAYGVESKCYYQTKVGSAAGKLRTSAADWDAVKIYWSSGTFDNIGRFKFFGRKA